MLLLTLQIKQVKYSLSGHKLQVKKSLQDRILDSVVFNRDIEVGHQEGHQLQRELDLKRQNIEGIRIQECEFNFPSHYQFYLDK